MLVPEDIVTETEIATSLGLIGAAALIGREVAVRAGQAWLGGRWTRLVPLFVTLFLLFWPAAAVVFDWESHGIELVCFVAAVAAAGFIYWRRLADDAAMTFVVGFAALFLIAVGLRLIDEAIGFEWNDAAPMIASTGMTILWSLLVFGIAAKLMHWLRSGAERVSP